MGKRRADEGDSDVDMDAEDLVQVDFDFFDIVDDDFLTIKNLLRQMFSLDSTKFDVSAVAQLVIDSHCGSTIKADDEEYNDVLALLSVVDASVSQHAQNPALHSLTQYWIERTQDDAELNRTLRRLFSPSTSSSAPKRVGMVVSERLLNMPFEVVPPLWTLLRDELAKAGQSYDYLVVPTRRYSEQEPAKDLRTDSRKPSTKKPRDAAGGPQLFPFHAEDDVLDELAVSSASFALETPVEATESRRAFQENGIYPWGHLIVLDFRKLDTVVERITQLQNSA